MLDTGTGAVWEFVTEYYCQSKTPPYDMRRVDSPTNCKNDEETEIEPRAFQRISVQGLYKTPNQETIDANIQKQK